MKNANYALYKTHPVKNLKELVLYGAKNYGNSNAFTYREKDSIKTVSYIKLKMDIDALGTGFYGLGLRDTRIAILGENSYEWILTAFAAMNGSNIIVPIDKELPAKEIANLLVESDCHAFVYSSDYADIIAQIKGAAGCIEFFIETGLAADNNSTLSFPQLLEKGRLSLNAGVTDFVQNKIDNHATAAIIFTSGTTGKSKGVMLSHASMAADAVGVLELVQYGKRSMLVLPLHHTYAFTAGVLIQLLSGSSIFINSSLKNFNADLLYHKPTDIYLVPMIVESLYKKIWETARQKGKEKALKRTISFCNAMEKVGIKLKRKLLKQVLHSFGGELKAISCGGALINPKFYKGFNDFGISLMNGYGITECSPVVSVERNHFKRVGSIGVPLRCCEVKIDKPNENGDGEILVRGPIVMKGYYNNPEATAAAFDGEWFKTGDIGHIDSDGFLFITGRKKNVIILSNGKNVYPEELELLVSNLPYVKEAVVYEEKDPVTLSPSIAVQAFFDADYIKAHAVDNMEAMFQTDIQTINKELPAFKRISAVHVRNSEFEKTASKKIKRNVIGGTLNV